jgi:hypothetical protein
MRPFRSALPLLGLLLAAACGSTPTQPSPQLLPLMDGEGEATTRTDPAEIVTATVEGDRLLLGVRYGGGCARHEFALRFSPVFLESDPVQSVLELAHDAKGDPCRALVGQTLAFDLSPLKRTYREAYGVEHGTILLRVHGPRERTAFAPAPRYVF